MRWRTAVTITAMFSSVDSRVARLYLPSIRSGRSILWVKEGGVGRGNWAMGGTRSGQATFLGNPAPLEQAT
jgi:hypothetical protein